MAKTIPTTLVKYLGIELRPVPLLAPDSQLGLTVISVINSMTSKLDLKVQIPAAKILEATLNAPFRRLLKFTRGHVRHYMRKRLGKRLIEYQMLFSYCLAALTGCKLSYFSNERTTVFPPDLDSFKSIMVANHFQRLVRSQAQLKMIRAAYINHQLTNHLAKKGYPAPLFTKI